MEPTVLLFESSLFVSSAKLERAKGFNIHKMFLPITVTLSLFIKPYFFKHFIYTTTEVFYPEKPISLSSFGGKCYFIIEKIHEMFSPVGYINHILF
jgi:hypothetical protein